MKETTSVYLKSMSERYSELSSIESSVCEAFEVILEAFEGDSKLLVCGNGGSAADADHIVGELMKGFMKKRRLDETTIMKINNLDSSGEISGKLQRGLYAINLMAHSALISATCNDNSADMIFAQQVIACGRAGDILLGISTSGNSPNIIKAGIVAKALGMKTVGLTGKSGGGMNEIFDILIKVPEISTSYIQELHMPVYHTLCAMLEEEMFEDD